MEHVLSCYETVPYFYADPETGEQMTVIHPVTGEPLEPCEELDVIPDGVLAALEPNENSVVEDIAVGLDYSVTIKDDGKPLYRWGTLVKRPNDVRLYARIPVPEAWKVPGALYEVVSAQLVIQHDITNNPNDQLRPEDFENEAVSPLATTEGWKAYLDGDGGPIDGLSVNGLPLTDDFDLAVYLKGEGKATTLFTAQFIVEWDNADLGIFSDGFESGDTSAWSTVVGGK